MLLQKMLLASLTEMDYNICVLFIGPKKPIKKNIAKLGLLSMSKNCVYSLLDFLVNNNSHLSHDGILFSQLNLDSLYTGPYFDGDSSIL